MADVVIRLVLVDRFSAAANRAAFRLLDRTRPEDRPVSSWEVEREGFLRSLPTYDPHA